MILFLPVAMDLTSGHKSAFLEELGTGLFLYISLF